MAEEFTSKFRVDISDLKKNITEARKEIKLADAAFKAGTAGMDDWKTDAEGLAQKLKQLKSVLQSQKSIMESYRQQLERQQSAYEENGSRAEQLRAKLQQLADSGVAKTSDEYKKYQNALKNVLKEQESNGKAVDDLRIKVLNQEAAVGKTEKELRNYSSALDQAGDETRQLSDASAEANQMTGRLTDGFTVMKGAIASLVADGFRALVRELKSLVTDGAEYADTILTMSKTTSLSTDTLQRFNYISGLADVELNTVAGSLKKLTKNMASAKDGSGSAADAFKTLRVSVTNADGTLRNNEQTFYDVIDALGEMENETERDALSMAIFGKSATDLNPLIEAGSDAMAEWSKEAEDMGYIMDEDMLGSLGELQDSFDRFDNQMLTVRNTVAARLAPALDKGVKKLQEMAKSVDWDKVGKQAGKMFDGLINAFQWIIQHGGVVKGTLAAILAAMAAQKIAQVVSGITKMTQALMAMNAAASANPYVLLFEVLAALVAGVAVWGKSLTDAYWAETDLGKYTDELTQKMEENAQVTEEMVSKYEAMDKARSDAISSTESEAHHLQALTDELGTLVDANGEVADSDRARADFILNELNDALGTEYDLTDLLNGKYQEMKDSVYQLIEAKRVEAILASQEQAYAQAVGDRENAEANLAYTVSERIRMQNENAVIEQQLAELNKKKWQEASLLASEDVTAEIMALEQKKAANDDYLAKIGEDYAAQSEIVNEYLYDIEQYEANWEAAHEGHYDAISTKSYETAQKTGEATRNYAAEVEANAQAAANNWLTQLNKMVSESTGKNVEFKDAGNGMVQAYINGQKVGEELPANQVRVMAQKMIWQAQELSVRMQQSGQNAAQGLANGSNQYAYLANAAGANLANQFLAGFRAAAGENSPWTTTAQSGLNSILGFVGSVEKNEGMVEKAGQSLAGAFNAAFNTTLRSQKVSFSGVVGAVRSMRQLAGGIFGMGASGDPGAAPGGGVTQNFTQNIYAPKQPSRIELYRQTRNLLNYAAGRI